MNSKLLKGSLAGVAALALAAGGTTFAAWSDFAIDEGNNVGADVLSLTVNEPTTQHFDDVLLAPGQKRDYAFYVASRNGTTVPKATLNMTIKKLTGTENGCDSNSEAYAESGSAIDDKTDGNAPCNLNQGLSGQAGTGTVGNLKGQFAQQAAYTVQAVKMSDPSLCTTSTNMPTVQAYKRLALMNDVPVDLLQGGTLAGGEGACVYGQIFLPNDAAQVGWAADNESQGDQASFDVRFDLQQVPIVNSN